MMPPSVGLALGMEVQSYSKCLDLLVCPTTKVSFTFYLAVSEGIPLYTHIRQSLLEEHTSKDCFHIHSSQDSVMAAYQDLIRCTGGYSRLLA